MRHVVFVRGVLSAVAVAALACGGGTPPPKDSDDVAASTAPKSSGEHAASTGGAESPAGPAASSSSASASAPAPSAAPAPSSGDLSAAGAGSNSDVWMASHQMPPGDVLKSMRAAQPKVQACFRAGLKRDPSTAGEVKIRFVITNDGQVRDWRDDGSSMSDEEVTKCVGDLIKTLKFPKQKSPGDAWGVYTIRFSP